MSWADYTAFLKKDGTVEHGALFNKDDASALAADGITVTLSYHLSFSKSTWILS